MVIDIDGDGSFLMNCQEMATAKVEGLDTKMFILNNQHLGMVVQWEDRFYKANRAHTYLGKKEGARPLLFCVPLARPTRTRIPGPEGGCTPTALLRVPSKATHTSATRRRCCSQFGEANRAETCLGNNERCSSVVCLLQLIRPEACAAEFHVTGETSDILSLIHI